MASFAPAHLPEVLILATYCTHFPIKWALSWCMASPTVSAWLSSVCCNLHFSSLGILWLKVLFYFIKCPDFCKIIQHHCLHPLCLNSLVPKANGKVRPCLDPARLNQALIRPVHQGPTLDDILPTLNNMQYISIIDASSGYHNLKLDKQSSYLTTFSCPFGRYQYRQ